LKQRPRPKSEPVVLGWMWLNMVMNAAVLSVVVIVVYVLALIHFCDGQVLVADLDLENESDVSGLMYARTVAFISLVLCENVRSYTSRSFDRPVWKNICGNKAMHCAIVLAQLALYIAVLVPFFSDQILELDGTSIGWWGWAVAGVGPVATLVLCELCKLVTGCQMRQHQRRLANAEKLEDQPVKVNSGPLARESSYNKLNDQNQVTV